MEQYLLDTNVIIRLLKGDETTMDALTQRQVHTGTLSVITYFEVLVGVEHARQSAVLAQSYLDRMSILPLTAPIGLQAARLSSLVGQHRMLHKDLLIGATCMVDGKTLLTYDRDFLKIPGMDVVVLA